MTLDQKQAQLAHLIELKNSTENLSNVLQALEKQVNVMTTTAEGTFHLQQRILNSWKIGNRSLRIFEGLGKMLVKFLFLWINKFAPLTPHGY